MKTEICHLGGHLCFQACMQESEWNKFRVDLSFVQRSEIRQGKNNAGHARTLGVKEFLKTHLFVRYSTQIQLHCSMLN